jgi:hypothetical protein
MNLRWLAALPAALLLVGAQALAGESKTIQIRVERAPEFDVVYHRALSNATGAAIGSAAGLAGVLIGGGIQSSIEADKDSTKRKTLEPHVAATIWNDVFVRTLSETLQAKGFDPLWLEGKPDPKGAKADIYLTLMPESYGFRMVDTNTALVSAYVEFDASYSQELKPRQKAPKEAFYLTHKKQASYEDLANQPAELNAEVEAVLAQAARRLANKIIYNVK